LAEALGSAQVAPQAPQLFNVVNGVSHPLVGSPSQSPQPGAQTGTHFPPMQLVVPCGLTQFNPHAPQFATVVTGVSQPSLTLPLASRTCHWPLRPWLGRWVEPAHTHFCSSQVDPTKLGSAASIEPLQSLSSPSHRLSGLG